MDILENIERDFRVWCVDYLILTWSCLRICGIFRYNWKRFSPKGENIEELFAHSGGTNLAKHAQFV